jgi:5-keto 4-deoxyuronate isomerase
MKNKKKVVYIYESPDKGKTVYRRVLGEPHETRQLIYTSNSKPNLPPELLTLSNFNPN